jgi:hypothetical protein
MDTGNESQETVPPSHSIASKGRPSWESAPPKTQSERQGERGKLEQNTSSMGAREARLTYWTKFSAGCIVGMVLAVLLEVCWWAPRRSCVEVQK